MDFMGELDDVNLAFESLVYTTLADENGADADQDKDEADIFDASNVSANLLSLFNAFPKSDVEHGYERKVPFVAAADTWTYQDPMPFLSSTATYYVVVGA